MIQLTLYGDGCESVPYKSGAFPLHVSTCQLSLYPDMRCISHWHDDYEFCVVHKGRCVYRVNGAPVSLSAGEGLYVAPRNMHGVEAVNGEDCEYLCVVFPASLLGASARTAETLRTHLAAHEAARCLRLLPNVPPHRAVIQGLLRVEELAGETSPEAELKTIGALYLLLADLGAAVRGEADLPKTDRNLSQVKDMIRYIHLHADRKLTLLDIARAGKLSRSSCESAFERVLHTSPIQYLLNFRLEKGLELLLSTSLTVTEIAQQCGFCSGSYFAEQLRKRSGVAPGEYRKKRRPLPAPPGVKP